MNETRLLKEAVDMQIGLIHKDVPTPLPDDNSWLSNSELRPGAFFVVAKLPGVDAAFSRLQRPGVGPSPFLWKTTTNLAFSSKLAS